MAGPWEAYQTRKEPSVKERATEANIQQSRASAGASQASAASSVATAQEKRALTPSKVRGAEAVARLNEARAATAELALEKTKRLMANVPKGEKAPEARAIILNQIRNIAQAKQLSKDMFGASGLGYSTIGQISGFPGAQVDGLMSSVLAEESFTALQKMRSESPTGGALGNVTEKELDLLKAAGGYIPPTAGDEAFQQGLDDLIAKRIRVLNKLGVSPKELAEALGPDNAEQFAPMVQSYRFRDEDAEALKRYVEKTMKDGTYDPSDYAALMGQAYYNATGNMPDEGYASGAYEVGVKVGEKGPSAGFSYGSSDENFRKQFLMDTGAAPQEELGAGEVAAGAALNFVPSAFQLGFDTVKGLTVELPQTLEGAAQIVGGAVGLTDPAQYEAVKDYFGERYGTSEGFKRALMTDPASIAADVVGVATGGGLLAAKTASTASKVTGIARLADAAKVAEGFTDAAAKFDPINIAAGTVQRGAGLAAGTAGRIGEGVARVVGAQPADLRQAVEAGRRGSPEFIEQLEGRRAPEDALGKADAAVSELYQARSKDYSRRMNRLKQNPETLEFTDVLDAVDGVRNVGRHKGIDVSGAAGVWDEVDAKIAEFESQGLNSIEDFDAMKQSVANIAQKYPRGTPENRVASQVAKAINKTITEKAPVYASVMNDYRVASDTLSDIKASISADAKSADTTLLKLRRSAGGAGPRGRKVIDILESTPSGRGLGDLLAGQNLADARPSLIGSSLGTGAAVATGDPTTLAASALSARGLGRGAYNLGVAGGKFGEAGDAIMQVPGVQRLAELSSKYADPTAQGIRMANPLLIQPQVDPVEITQPEELDALVRAYTAGPPEMQPAGGNLTGPGAALSLEDYSAPGAQVSLSDYATPKAAASQTGTEVLDIGSEEYYDVDELGRRIDPITRLPIEEEEVVGMQRGGAVKGYQEGGRVDETAFQKRQREQAERQAAAARRVEQQMGAERQAKLAANQQRVQQAQQAGRGRTVSEGRGYNTNAARARTAAQGLLLASADEIEAGLRAGGRGIMEGRLPSLAEYYGIKDEINRGLDRYSTDMPGEAASLEIAGAVLPSLIPGTQGVTGPRLAQLAARYPGRAGAARVGAESIAYGVGSADRPADIPRSVVEEGLIGAGMYGGIRAAGAGARKGSELLGRAAGRSATTPNAQPPLNTFTVTPEATPGFSTGHRSDIQSAPFSVREDYQRDASFVRDGDDVLYRALGVPQKTQRGIGAYINSANTLETNPVNVTGVDFGELDRDTILAIEKMRGVIDAQEAMAGNMPIADAAGNARYFGMGRPPSADEMEFFTRNAPKDFGVTPTTDGALMFPFDSSMSASEAAELLRPTIDQVPNYRAVPVRNDMGFYEPAMGRFDENFDIVPSPAFSGEATMDMLEALSRAPQSVSDKLSAAPDFADVLKQKYLRDAGAPTTREDIQNTRMLMADPKFAEAVKLIRQGVSPAAALAAIGYATSALAAPTRE